jgi:photosystem II stability/assembly factor-like uncharacterized protein
MRRQGILLALCLFLLAAPAAAAEWTPIGPDGGSVHSLSVAPSRPAVVYAGTRYGGVFRSTDRAKSWSFAGLRGSWIWDLTVDPKNPDTVYAGTERGLLKSTDGGASWRPAGLVLPGATIVLVKVHPARPATVFAVADGSLYRTADRGRTWVSEPGWPQGVGTLSFAPGRPNVLYAGTDTAGLWKSTDSGRTWRRISSELSAIEALVVDPRAPRTLYAASLQGFTKSTDGGSTWTVIGPPDAGWPKSSITIDPANSSILYVSAAGWIYRSLDRGATWAVANAGLPGSVGRAVTATRYGLLAGSSTGVFLSTDRAAAWLPASRGITASSIGELAVAAQEPPRLYAITERGLFKSQDRGRTWLPPPSGHPLTPGLPHPLTVDPSDADTLYTGDFQRVVKSTDGGQTWTGAQDLPCVVPVKIALDPRMPDTLYAAGLVAVPRCFPPGPCTFARSLDAGATWECLPAPGLLLHVDPFTSAVYLGLQDLLRSTDRGASWDRLFAGLNAAFFNFLPSVVSSPLVPGTLWAGRRGEVGRSRDGGQTWEFFSAGLPPLDLVALAPDPVDPETLYAGTRQDGVFKSTDAGETWSPVGTWPAGVILQRGLAVDPADPSILYAGTDIASVLMLDQEN